MNNPPNIKPTGRFGLSIDTLPEGVHIFITNGNGNSVLVGLARRQAKAFANRILHEIDFQEGKRDRRPSTPHLFGQDLIGWRTPEDSE